MNRRDVRSTLIAALAAKRRRDPASVEAELRVAGPDCPCDSQWLVKAGVGAAKDLGVRFKPNTKDAWAFKSIESLTTYLLGLVEQEEAA